MKKLNFLQRILLPKGALYVPSKRIFCLEPSKIRVDICCKIIYWSGFRWKKTNTELYFRDTRQLNKNVIDAKALRYLK